MSMICPPLYCPNHQTFTIWLDETGACPVCAPTITEPATFALTQEELGNLAYIIGLGVDRLYERPDIWRDTPTRRTADWGRAFISRLAAQHKGQHHSLFALAKCRVCGEVRDGSYTGYPT